VQPRLLLLVPAVALLVLLSTAMALCLSALHVYFRDVRYLVAAALTVWIYATPIIYPMKLLGPNVAHVVDLNPVTGIVILFHFATVGGTEQWRLPVVVSIFATVVLFAAGIEMNRRHDRLFVDLL
jgi:lipopolysaccharide transport system permease protein